MNRRTAFLVCGLLLIVAGLFLPREWYDALPRSKENLPPLPVKGVTLLQIAFVLEGALAIFLSNRVWKWRPLDPSERLSQDVLPADVEDLSRSLSNWLIVAITALGLVLRCINLGSDLWLDEITTVFAYRDMPVLHVIASYISSNNHLLNTLLMKLALSVFGEQEWAVRLPAVLFGTATIPAVYWVAQLAVSRRVSLLSSLLLATSYHHIFFSQNARGYTAYLFFSILASGFLTKGLEEDRVRDWVPYVLLMFLNFASLLDTLFVFAAHLLVGIMAIVALQRKGGSVLPLARRLAAVFLLTGVLVLNLYITMAPQFYFYSKTVYRDPAAGFSPFSAEFFREFARGLSAGLGPSVLLLLFPALFIAVVGFVALLKRRWTLTLALSLPGILTAAFLIMERLDFSPRFFLLWLPLAMLAVAQGVFETVAWIAQKMGSATSHVTRRVATLLILLGVGTSLFALRRYYLVPKQSYRESLRYVAAHRQPDQPVIAIYLVEPGCRFYGERLGLKEGEDWFVARSRDGLDSVLSRNPGRPSIVITTFARALRISRPDLFNRIVKGWTLERTFPATIGDGEISIWKQRAEVAESNP